MRSKTIQLFCVFPAHLFLLKQMMAIVRKKQAKITLKKDKLKTEVDATSFCRFSDSLLQTVGAMSMEIAIIWTVLSNSLTQQ
jgi:hypothetical protein